jgi:hypothetical protein
VWERRLGQSRQSLRFPGVEIAFEEPKLAVEVARLYDIEVSDIELSPNVEPA